MAKSKFILHNTIKSLKKMQKEKAFVKIRDHLRATVMLGKGKPYAEIADALGYSYQWVKKVASDYTRAGLEGLMPKVRPGAECFLDPDQLIELYGLILDGPKEEELLSRYRISDLQEIVQEKWDIEYSVSGMHALLKRMLLSHVTTRPQNPKNDPALMELWKKKRRASSIEKRKSTVALKSGTRTKQGLGKRASVIESGPSKG